MISLFTYTHTNCKDIWPAYYGRLNKYFKDALIYSMVNDFENIPHINNSIVYDDNKSYSDEFVRCLEQIPNDFFIYMQEDFILYDFVNIEEIKRCIKFLQNSNFSYIRLIKCGDVTDIKIDKNLYLVSKDGSSNHSINSFSMQPTIWKKKDFINLYLNCNSDKFGENYNYTFTLNRLNMNGCYYYNGEPARGGHHDSSIFPYIATAIVKGKWNYSEYPSELDLLFKEYSIDKHLRGCR